MATKTRPYHLTKITGDGPAVERIVEATSRQQALYHAARTDWNVEPLAVGDAMRLGAAGIKPETAGEVEVDQLPLLDDTNHAGDFIKATGLVD